VSGRGCPDKRSEWVDSVTRIHMGILKERSVLQLMFPFILGSTGQSWNIRIIFLPQFTFTPFFLLFLFSFFLLFVIFIFTYLLFRLRVNKFEMIWMKNVWKNKIVWIKVNRVKSVEKVYKNLWMIIILF